MDEDELGREKLDGAVLETRIDKFGGGPVGLETLSAMTGEDASTIEDVYEPYLMQLGFLTRTPGAARRLHWPTSTSVTPVRTTARPRSSDRETEKIGA